MTLLDERNALVTHLTNELGAEAREVIGIQGFARAEDLQQFAAFTPGALVSVVEATRADLEVTRQWQVTIVTRREFNPKATRNDEQLRLHPQIMAAIASAGDQGPGASPVRASSVFRTKTDKDVAVSVWQYEWTSRGTAPPPDNTLSPWEELRGEMNFKTGDEDGAVIEHRTDLT